MNRARLTGIAGLSLTLAFVAGCEPPEGHPIDNEPASLPQSGLAEAAAEYLCDMFEACPAQDPITKSMQLFMTAGGDCRAQLLEMGFVDGVIDAWSVDLERFNMCAARSVAECVEMRLIEGCADALAGSAEADAPCDVGGLCAPGLYCDPTPDVDAGVCDTRCVPQRMPGEACDRDAECAAVDGRGGECYRDGERGRCVTARTERAALGEACGRRLTDDGLVVTGCGDDGACLPGRDAEMTCRALAARGEPCLGFGLCARDSVCIDGVCAAPPIRNEPGGACSDDFDEGEVCNPLRGLACIGGTCVQAGGAVGDVCEPHGRGRCRAGAYCTGEGVCAAQRAVGERCDAEGGWDQCAQSVCVQDLDSDDFACQADAWALCQDYY